MGGASKDSLDHALDADMQGEAASAWRRPRQGEICGHRPWIAMALP